MTAIAEAVHKHKKQQRPIQIGSLWDFVVWFVRAQVNCFLHKTYDIRTPASQKGADETRRKYREILHNCIFHMKKIKNNHKSKQRRGLRLLYKNETETNLNGRN